MDKYRNKVRQLKRIRVGNPLAEITNFQTTESSDLSSDEGTRQFFFQIYTLKILFYLKWIKSLHSNFFMTLQKLFVKLKKDGSKAIPRRGKSSLANGNLLLTIGTKS